MKKGWERFFKLIGFGVFTVVVFAPFSAVNTVVAHTDPAPQFPVDRWNPDWTDQGRWGPGMMEPGHRQRMTRHSTFMNEGVPSKYRGQLNPLAPAHSVVQAGGMLYQQQCAVCHGLEGMGDGEAANSVNPSPALLAYMIQRPQSVDEYLMWTISEGGKAFGTAMPVFKDALSEEEIWKIITFMRAGFPPLEKQ
jgi:mono/diheme cytochrome c family protein